MTAMALVQGLFTGPKGEAAAILEDRETHRSRLAQDPVAVGDMMNRGIKHIDSLLIAKLQDAKREARETVEKYCDEIDSQIALLEQYSEPAKDGITKYTAFVSFLTDTLNRSRMSGTEP